jgi:hypothetical protein
MSNGVAPIGTGRKRSRPAGGCYYGNRLSLLRRSKLIRRPPCGSLVAKGGDVQRLKTGTALRWELPNLPVVLVVLGTDRPSLRRAFGNGANDLNRANLLLTDFQKWRYAGQAFP